MAADKAKLLQSLRIARTDAVQTPARRRRAPLLVAVAVALVAAVSLLGLFAAPFAVDRHDGGVGAT